MRKQKEYLPKLLEYIELANKIPAGFTFPVKNAVYDQTFERLGKPPTISMEEIIETYKIMLQSFPKDLFEYVFDTKIINSWEEYEEIRRRIHLLSSLNYGLISLAQFVNLEFFTHKDESDLSINDYLLGLRELPQYLADLDVEILVNEEGFIELNTSEFFQLIATYKIEARRIRECVICPNIFWANRIDKWTCSKTCGNILRQRTWQSGNKDEYNEKRRTNYAYKKAMKKQKEIKKNGTL